MWRGRACDCVYETDSRVETVWQLGRVMFEMCKQTLRVLKPGGLLHQFSQPRLSHWMAVAWRSGFEIRDS